MREKIFNRFVLVAIIIAVVLVADQISKSIVYRLFVSNADEPYLIEIAPFFNIILNWNYGISFGFMNDHNQSQGLLIAMSLLIGALLFYWMVKSKEDEVHIPIGLIIGGALGNVADRLYYGAVVDFLDFHAFGYHYPAFNLADIAIVTGAILLIFLPEIRKRKAAGTQPVRIAAKEATKEKNKQVKGKSPSSKTIVKSITRSKTSKAVKKKS